MPEPGNNFALHYHLMTKGKVFFISMSLPSATAIENVMKSKVISVLLRRASQAGGYSCPDGEVESMEGFTISRDRENTGNSGADGDSGSGDGAGEGDSGNGGVSGGTFSPVPTPEVIFTMERSVVPGWHNHPDNPPAMTAEISDPSERGWSRKARECLSLLDRSAAKAGLFTEPFLALCAYRLKDGSHIAPSPPVLLIPNREAPFVRGGLTTRSSR